MKLTQREKLRDDLKTVPYAILVPGFKETYVKYNLSKQGKDLEYEKENLNLFIEDDKVIVPRETLMKKVYDGEWGCIWRK